MLPLLPPFAHVVDSSKKPRDGTLFPCLEFCKRADAKKCETYYREILEKPGYHKCPFGFASFVAESNGAPIAHTCLNVPGVSDRRALKSRKRSDFLPKTSPDIVERILDRSKSAIAAVEADARRQQSRNPVLASQNQRLQQELRHQRGFIQTILHEVRRLNTEIKSQAEEALAQIGQSSQGHFRVENIFATSSIISTRLNAYDLTTNPEIVFSEQMGRVGVFRKFDKVVRCLDSMCRKRHITISLQGTSRHQIYAYPCFELIPFLLLENSIKFSPDYQTITVSFEENDRPCRTIARFSA